MVLLSELGTSRMVDTTIWSKLHMEELSGNSVFRYIGIVSSDIRFLQFLAGNHDASLFSRGAPIMNIRRLIEVTDVTQVEVAAAAQITVLALRNNIALLLTELQEELLQMCDERVAEKDVIP